MNGTVIEVTDAFFGRYYSSNTECSHASNTACSFDLIAECIERVPVNYYRNIQSVCNGGDQCQQLIAISSNITCQDVVMPSAYVVIFYVCIPLGK